MNIIYIALVLLNYMMYTMEPDILDGLTPLHVKLMRLATI